MKLNCFESHTQDSNILNYKHTSNQTLCFQLSPLAANDEYTCWKTTIR